MRGQQAFSSRSIYLYAVVIFLFAPEIKQKMATTHCSHFSQPRQISLMEQACNSETQTWQYSLGLPLVVRLIRLWGGCVRDTYQRRSSPCNVGISSRTIGRNRLEIKNAFGSVARRNFDRNHENYSPEILRPFRINQFRRKGNEEEEAAIRTRRSNVEMGIEVQRIRNNNVRSKRMKL